MQWSFSLQCWCSVGWSPDGPFMVQKMATCFWCVFSLWSLDESFTAQKMDISSHIPAVEGLKEFTRYRGQDVAYGPICLICGSYFQPRDQLRHLTSLVPHIYAIHEAEISWRSGRTLEACICRLKHLLCTKGYFLRSGRTLGAGIRRLNNCILKDVLEEVPV